jgi:photosystem II stability/assembly factor-like uncharacterized protein
MYSGRLILTAVVLVAGALAPAAAADDLPATYGPWRHCKIGGGGYIQGVVLCPSDPDRYYAYVDVAGAYRSDDRGASWRSLSPGLPVENGTLNVRSLLVDPRDADRVLIAAGERWGQTPDGVYLSGDGGVTWRRTLDASFFGNGPFRMEGVLLARSPADPDTVLAASVGGGVFRSTDGGVTWRLTGLESVYPTDCRFDPSDPNHAWVCSARFDGSIKGRRISAEPAFYRSADGGLTWEKVSDASPREVLRGPAGDGRLFGLVDRTVSVSTDHGDTWQPFADGLPPRTSGSGPSEDEFRSLAAGPDFVLTASTKGTFYRLPAGGDRWQKVEREGIEEIYEGETWFRHYTGGFGSALGSITVDPRDSDHWFFTDWYALYQTFDAGRHWKLTIDGIECTVLHCLTQDPTDPGVVHLGMADNGYFISENGGERFSNVGWRKGITNNVKSVSLCAALPSRLYATSCSQWQWAANQVFVSIDRGGTWTRSPMDGLPDMNEHHCDTIEVDPRDPYTVYLTVSQEVGPGKGGVYRSTDGGRSWEWFGRGLPQGQGLFAHDIWVIGREIAAGTDGSLVCLSRSQRRVFRYDPAEGSWREVAFEFSAPPNCVVADASAPGRYLLAADGVYISNDGGRSWDKVYDGRVNHVAVDRAKPARLAAGAVDGVILSTDGGRTWTMQDQRLPHRNNPLVTFAGERLLAGTFGNGAFWMPLSPAGLEAVRARPATIARVGGGDAAVPTLVNGSMTEGGEVPVGWTSMWRASGTLRVMRDTEEFRKGPASLCLMSVGGPAKGSVSQPITDLQRSFRVTGFARTEGDLKECLVAIQAFDKGGEQVGWQTLMNAVGADDWTQFSAVANLGPDVTRAVLVMTFEGDGRAWLDEVEITPTPRVFR